MFASDINWVEEHEEHRFLVDVTEMMLVFQTLQPSSNASSHKSFTSGPLEGAGLCPAVMCFPSVPLSC